MAINALKLDEIYSRYGYDLKRKNNDYRVYVLRQGMYYGAEIVPLNFEIDSEKIKEEFSAGGYMAVVRKYSNASEAESKLFEGFFNTKMTLRKLKEKYHEFTVKQTCFYKNTPEYRYINSPFKINNSFLSNNKLNIIDTVISAIEKKGPVFIIIEAAAGFGKTCTAYEVLNRIISAKKAKNPLFTELSRNRQARIFKYVLLSEIEEQFHSMINMDLIDYHIKSGKIPLIIDGFDELLSKDLDGSKSGNDFEQVETMLYTISDLLKNNAKIILTSRKTAIFSGQDFVEWVDNHSTQFEVIRITIEEPKFTDWLSELKIADLTNAGIPLPQIANPVLLSYLRYMDTSAFKKLLAKPDTIVATYFSSLLSREQERQNLKISNEQQLTIFKNLAILFAELNITSEDKTFVKEIIIEYNHKLLNECRKDYPVSTRPTIDELADTLSNHALLDRIGNKDKILGFINDFVFGMLVGEAILEGNLNSAPESIAELAVNAFRFQSKDKKEKLWQIFDNKKQDYSTRFKLICNLMLKNFVYGNYEDELLDSINFNGIDFNSSCSFTRCTFTNCKFENCVFSLDIFKKTSFMECSFYNCQVVREDENDAFYKDNVMTFSCRDSEKGFLEQFDIYSSESDTGPETKDYQLLLLEKFFKIDGKTTKINDIELIKNDFEEDEYKQVLKEIHNLTTNGFIITDGRFARITQEGIHYYHKNQ